MTVTKECESAIGKMAAHRRNGREGGDSDAELADAKDKNALWCDDGTTGRRDSATADHGTTGAGAEGLGIDEAGPTAEATFGMLSAEG